jgi:hypothetical protein
MTSSTPLMPVLKLLGMLVTTHRLGLRPEDEAPAGQLKE